MTTTRKMLSVAHRATSGNTSVDAEKRTATLVWSTGSKGLRSGWGEKFYEELSMDTKAINLSRLQTGAPLLASHDTSIESIIGVVDRAWIENGQGLAQVRFGKDEKADAIFQKVVDGIITSVSVGYSVERYLDVSGDSDVVSTFRAVEWTPLELSLVAIPFDAQAKIRTQSQENEVEIISRQNSSEGKQMKEPKDENLNPAVQAERNRVTEIMKFCRESDVESLAEAHIENGTSAEKSRELVKGILELKNKQAGYANIDNKVRVELGHSNDVARREMFEEAIVQRIVPGYQTKADTRQFQNKTLVRSLEDLYGRQLGEGDQALVKRAMSTSDFPMLLANIAEKALQNRYAVQPRSFEKWVRRDTLRNYKQYSKVRAGDFPSLIERSEGAEYQYGSFGEQQEVAQLKDHGRIVKFTSQAIINDDLGALSTVANEGALSAARIENNLVYSALQTNKTMGDGNALYHASHGNLGTAGAIGDTTVGEAYKLMRKQKSVDGLNTLNLAPSFLICGPDKEQEARKFLAAINPNQTSNVNIYSGLLQLVIDPEITGNQYYFVCDPALVPTVVLFGLDGQTGPSIQTRVNWNTDSLEVKVAHAVTAEPMDWRGLLKNAGN